MVSIQIKMIMMMDQDCKDYVGDNDDEKKTKIMVSIQIKMMMMDQVYKDYVGN